MNARTEIESIPRYDWTYSDGMDFKRGVGKYVEHADARAIWDDLLSRAEAAEAALTETQRERDELRELLADRENDLLFEATGRRTAEDSLDAVRQALAHSPG